MPRIAAAIHDFRRRYPAVNRAVSEVAGAAQLPAILDGSLYVGFMRSPACPLVYLPLLDEAAHTALWLLHHHERITLPCRHFLALTLDPDQCDHW